MRSFVKYKLLLACVSVAGFLAMTIAPASALAAPLKIATPPTHLFAAGCEDVTPGNAADQLKSTGSSGQGLNCIVSKYIDPAIKLMGGLAGVVITINIVIGAIQYSSAGGDSGKVAAARGRITKALIALLAFIFLFAFLNFILPGGING